MYDLGFKLLKRMCHEQNPLEWYRAKLSDPLFRGPEKEVFGWIDKHVQQFHALPQIETLNQAFPVMAAVQAIEPIAYYVHRVEKAFAYAVINQANIDSQAALKMDQDASDKALEILKAAERAITQQTFRTKILDVTGEGVKAVFTEYHGIGKSDNIFRFGWEYLDHQSGGVVPGAVVSFVGRPAQGKTWMMLYIAMHNWLQHHKNVLFVSMEMLPLEITQRIASMQAQVPFKQLMLSGFSSQTYQKFVNSMSTLMGHDSKMYVVDGNLAVDVEEIFVLADLFGCDGIVVDGAYLLRHRDKRLNRFERVAANAELMKQRTTEVQKPTFTSWQFSRTAVKGKGKGEEAGLEDIGMSDVIPQVSTIVVAMDQVDSVETMKARRLRIIKGRSGQVGQFNVKWDFDVMDFSEYVPPDEKQALQHI